MRAGRTSADDRESVRPLTLAALGVIVIAAAVLRFTNIGRESAWIDEVLSISSSTGDLISVTKRLEPHQLPLFLWLNWLFVLRSSAEGWLRLPPALLGIGLVPLVLLIGVELGSVRVGLTAAALVAVSKYLISYSQEIRMYALVAFLGLLGTWATLRLRRAPTQQVAWVVLGISSFLNLYTSPFTIFIVAIHCGVVAFLTWPDPALRRRFRTFVQRLGVAYIPALLHMLPMLTGSASVVQNNADDYAHFAPLVTISLTHFAGLIPGIAVLLALGSLLGAAIAWRQCRAFAVIAVASFVVPIVLLYVARPGHFFNPRYLIYAQPHLLLLAAIAMVWLWDLAVSRFESRPRGLDVIGPGAVGVIIVIAMTQLTPDHELIGRRADWRSIARTILDGLHEHDLVVTKPFFENNTLLYHLDQLSPAGRRVKLTPESDRCWYGNYHRRVRLAASPEDFLGPSITVVGITQPEQLDHLPTVEGNIWLITNDLPDPYAKDFQAVLRLAPVESFSSNDPAAESPHTLVLYRRQHRSAVDAAVTDRTSHHP